MSIIIIACEPAMSLADKLSVAAYWVQATAACGALYLASKVYRRVLNQKVAENRLGLVVDIIELYQKNAYTLTLIQKGFGGNADNFSHDIRQITLFGLASMHPIAKKSDFDLQVIIPSGFIVNFDKSPTTVATNPLFPSEIASLIIGFNTQMQRISVNELDKSKHIVMGEAAPNFASVSDFLDKNVALSYIGGFRALVAHSSIIVNAIDKWLRTNEITPNNQSTAGGLALEGWQILH